MNKNLTVFVKKTSRELGFDFCGIARAVRLDDDARRLEKWLEQKMHGGMQYMENYFELRIDPSRLVPGARSVITMMLNYSPEPGKVIEGVSKYAWGKDYHLVIREKLNQFIALLKMEAGDFHGRGFVDSAPVLERSWAQRSGLGWIGKNGNLISKEQGSFFFIATLITDLQLEYDDPFAKDFCGTCTRCIDACPTEAILPGKVVDGSKCISYFTIELKEMLMPENMQGKFENWTFGCDTCQDVCPWNRFSKPHHENNFQPSQALQNMQREDWSALTEERFRELFRDSPLKRPGYERMMRNIRFTRQDQKSDIL
jgi:epoxyqueuosine reductase